MEVKKMVGIAELRAKHGKMSQRELAKQLGTTQTSVSNWEKNPLSISGSYLIKLAILFNVSTDDLLGVEANKDDNKVSA
jgi:transcriptional regulator with XRE-family HTH domain